MRIKYCDTKGCVFTAGHTIKHSFEYTGDL